jgi:hypothetical protein
LRTRAEPEAYHHGQPGNAREASAPARSRKAPEAPRSEVKPSEVIGGKASGVIGWPLSPRAARVFYNAFDAWRPPEDGFVAADPVEALAPELGDPRERVRLERALLWLEWSPRLLLHSRRGLSWMERGARRAWLDRLERRGPPPLRRAAARVHAAVGRQSLDGA